MASNPSQKCCFEGFYHEGTAKGRYTDVFGIETYVIGEQYSNDKVLILFTDYFGIHFNNSLLIADQLSAKGYKVYIPDILFGDAVDPNNVENLDLQKWLSAHNEIRTKPMVDKFMASFKKEINPGFLGVLGYCFGAKYAIQQIHENTGTANAAAIAHPSFVTIEEVAAIGKRPLLISAAETDPVFAPELRKLTEEKLKEIGSRYQIDLFSGTSHGFAVRGDLSDPQVLYAKEKAFYDQVYWFDHLSQKK
ncbi:similar to Saccharomyces cerevisiae YAL049C AIM2 Cytoplasmic protein involved in mitochondrial function or organization [Maudiozyma barnettii]|uniref:Similar to Saccharomyces cerevisiae YAL049C AIM2 Cytoplasmic protein involved in mitochondrial function or organization n=1 Tax=Maudiozyma barnettii TaxID=61262 RepID=A0A8H2VG15_9SACH|nr:protein AIM2 [Kazachstania barnettii]CAB4254832.1 similar to Saccharomyces cerevisiae YAL049C AIM2 Cytoplasmic protein involved in mitochondrial function or organization [Kazachstania barnettii]CAD1783025.1 similar to Saccharomyces cerevisiae YAL049C AIM2 Cytoplasmic protein involved in mitochondrial function or organization [Kazachstania barnettii]